MHSSSQIPSPPSKMKSKESYFYSPGKRTDNLPCFFVGNLENYSVPSNCKGKWVILFPTTGANGFILLLHTAERKFVISYFVRLEKFILLFVKLKGIILFSLCTPFSLSFSLSLVYGDDWLMYFLRDGERERWRFGDNLKINPILFLALFF